mmetsp:Transcript_104238/g.185209  ORF Transcript_104238/g.185209 Transcript_104238/m.185209 type:complete len:223 (+) Transcript_104238:1438-2106(+)
MAVCHTLTGLPEDITDPSFRQGLLSGRGSFHSFKKISSRQQVGDEVEGSCICKVLEKSKHSGVVQGLQLVNFFHDETQRIATAQCFLLVDSLQHSYDLSLFALGFSNNAEGAFPQDSLNSVVIFGLTLAPADEHLSGEVSRLQFVELHQKQAAVELLILCSVKQLIAIKVKTPEVLLHVPVREVRDAQVCVHPLNTAAELIVVEHSIAVLVKGLEAHACIVL